MAIPPDVRVQVQMIPLPEFDGRLSRLKGLQGAGEIGDEAIQGRHLDASFRKAEQPGAKRDQGRVRLPLRFAGVEQRNERIEPSAA